VNPDATTSDLSYSVPGVSCAHCEAAITEEVGRVHGVTAVDVDLEARRVAVAGTGLDEAAVRAAIEAAGYDVER
jgi:copper chaperone